MRWGAPSSLPHPRPLGLALLGLALAACQAPGDPEAPGLEAKFGVFYGGQVQELDDIPLSLDSARQRQGFRLELTPPPELYRQFGGDMGLGGGPDLQPDGGRVGAGDLHARVDPRGRAVADRRRQGPQDQSILHG